jgi:hypothetical protein
MLGPAAPRYPQVEGWVLHQRNCPTALSFLTDCPHFLSTAKHRAFPLPCPVWVTRAPQLMATIRAFLLAPRSCVIRPAPTPGTASAGISRALLSTPPNRWLQVDLCVPCCPPCRLRVPHDLDHPFSLGRYQVSLGHTHVFSTVSPAHTVVRRGGIHTPSPPSCRLDHSPSLADRFILGVAPFDDDPAVLRTPFRPSLAGGALPSEAFTHFGQ